MAVNIRTDPPFDYLKEGEQFQGIHGEEKNLYMVSNVLRMQITAPYSHFYLQSERDRLYLLLESAGRTSIDFSNEVSRFTKKYAEAHLTPLSDYLIADALYRMSGPEPVVHYNGDWSQQFVDFGILNGTPMYSEGKRKGSFTPVENTLGFVVSTYGLSTANSEHPVIRRTAFAGLYMHRSGFNIQRKLCMQLAEIAVGNFVSNSELGATTSRKFFRGGRADGNTKSK